MLSIAKEPFYKNKLVLSSFAVVVGFSATVGLIRAVSPGTETTRQSAQSSSERRSSLLPINASASETSSESGTDSTSGSESQAVSNQPTSQTGAAYIAPFSNSTASGSTHSTQSSPPTSSTPPVQSTPPTPKEGDECEFQDVLGIFPGVIEGGICVKVGFF